LWTAFSVLYWDTPLVMSVQSAENPAFASDAELRELRDLGILGELMLDAPPKGLRGDVPPRLRERLGSDACLVACTGLLKAMYTEHAAIAAGRPRSLGTPEIIAEAWDFSLTAPILENRLLAELAVDPAGRYLTLSSDNAGYFEACSRTPVTRWEGAASLALEITGGFPVPSRWNGARELLDVKHRQTAVSMKLWRVVDELCSEVHEARFPSELQRILDSRRGALTQAISQARRAYGQRKFEYEMVSTVMHLIPAHEAFWAGIADIGSVRDNWLARVELPPAGAWPSRRSLELRYSWIHDYVYSAVGARSGPYMCTVY
jgi:hypothetical protein